MGLIVVWMCSSRRNVKSQIVASGGKKIDLSKQGLSSVANDVIRRNLEGVSKYMDKKDWKDSSGRQGKVGTTLV